MAEHFKEICSNCKGVIRQCRCPDQNKTTTYTICQNCLGNTNVSVKPALHANIAKVTDLTSRLNGILQDPQYGHFTWYEAVRNLMTELRDALDVVLDPSPRTHEERRQQSRDLYGND